MIDALRRRALGLVVIVLAVVVWQVVALARPNPYAPSPEALLGRFHEDWLSGPANRLFLSDQFIDNVGPTVHRLAFGWAIGVVVGLLAGGLIASSKRLRYLVDPLTRLGMSTPAPALLPIAIALFGLGGGMKVFFIAFGTVWPVLINTVAGLRDVDEYVINVGRSLRLSPVDEWLHVRIPLAMPRIMSGIRIGTNAAVLLIAVAELYASTSGIGFVIVRTQRDFDVIGTWSAILMLCLIGVVANALLAAFDHRIMHWYHQRRRQS